MKQPIMEAVKQCKNSQIINPELVELGFKAASLVSHQYMLDMFIERTHPNWVLISHSQDVVTVLKPTLSGFQELGTSLIDEILRVVESEGVDMEIQKKLLTLGRSLVKISLRYLHENRPPNAPPDIDIPAVARLYGLELGPVPSSR